MEDAVKAQIMTNVNDKMKNMGLGGIIGGAAKTTPQMDHLSTNQMTQNSSAAGGAMSESQDE